jgi:hypothetical protein
MDIQLLVTMVCAVLQYQIAHIFALVYFRRHISAQDTTWSSYINCHFSKYLVSLYNYKIN